MTALEDIPPGMHGTPVNELGAALYRPRHTDTASEVGVWVWGAHADAESRWRSESGFAVTDRKKLRELIDALQVAYWGWPGECR